MNKKFIFISAIFLTLSLSGIAHAEIYKTIDADGHVTYSNVKTKGAKKVILEPADTNFGTNTKEPSKRATTKSATPEGFPKVDTETQKQRDGSRKEILQSELETEKKALEEAKKALAEGGANPEIYHKKNADGSTSTLRNVPKFDEKMKKLQDEVDAHQRNIELLEKEISQIR